MNALRQILLLWRTWVIVLAPLLLVPLPIYYEGDRAAKCAYVILIMATYWMTEAIPMAATALLPIALMPWLGVMGSKDLCKNYLKDTNMLFVGGLLVAVAVEKWNLHKRIALGVLLFVGSKPKWLMFGFMITTAFLSMWLSNTATTAMMIPITQAVLAELDNHRKSQRHAKRTTNYSKLSKVTNPDHEIQETSMCSNGHTDPSAPPPSYKQVTDHVDNREVSSVDPTDVTVLGYQSGAKGNAIPEAQQPSEVKIVEPDIILTEDEKREDESFSELSKGLTLCVAYAANIGGTATLTGTGPNLIIKGQVDTLYGGDAGLNFSSWFVFSFPNMILSLFMAWMWLQIMFLGPKVLVSCLFKDKGPKSNAANQVIRAEYNKLGPWSFAEISTLFFFVLIAVLWFTREPEFMPGWSELFTEGFVTDASVAITVGLLLFMFPSRKPNILCFRPPGEEGKPGPVPALLDWETVHIKMPWNVIIVLGGGFALADACKVSGLSSVIGNAFNGFSGIPVWTLVLALCVITAGFTEVASNTATATIFLPILAELAVAMHVNPLYLMLAVTVATSLAFMLPVATPPNAMVFAYGHMKIIDMVKAGIVMNILCILSLTLAINTWGYAYFDLGTFPAWADSQSLTSTSIPDFANNSSMF